MCTGFMWLRIASTVMKLRVSVKRQVISLISRVTGGFSRRSLLNGFSYENLKSFLKLSCALDLETLIFVSVIISLGMLD
jgi:hypothetical protein